MKYLRYSPIVLAGILVCMPIFAYIVKFGIGFWGSHEDWALMGSYFGGTVGPLVTSLSLIFLGYQIRNQSIERREEKELHICTECELDISKYLPRVKAHYELDANLNKLRDTILLRKSLIEQNQDKAAKELVRTYVSDNFEVSVMWGQIETSLNLIKERKEYKFRRMRALIWSEIPMETIFLLDVIRSNLAEGVERTCLYPEKA